MEKYTGPLEQIDAYRWRIPASYKTGMRVPGIIYADEAMMQTITADMAPDQVANVACLPGIVRASLAHSGSRGLGYQVCDDYLGLMKAAAAKYGIELPDRQLVSVPVLSPEGQRYLGAMRAAANFGFCNRQLLTLGAREVFGKVFNRRVRDSMRLVYDVCHNIAKFEDYEIDGVTKKLCVHRKGATRAFPAGHPEVPEPYRAIGQPVLIPGDMGRASYVLRGNEVSMRESFGTTCHGAGRAMSRTAAKKKGSDKQVQKELEARGVIARARGRFGLSEERPDAYKNVNDVVDIVHHAGLSLKVARMKPVGVIKG
mgnify:CR=1 FL=1